MDLLFLVMKTAILSRASGSLQGKDCNLLIMSVAALLHTAWSSKLLTSESSRGSGSATPVLVSVGVCVWGGEHCDYCNIRSYSEAVLILETRQQHKHSESF